MKGFLTSRFRGDKINELFNGKHRLWVEILSKSFEDHIEIKKRTTVRFSSRWTGKFRISICIAKEKGKKKERSRVASQKPKRQTGGFLNRYDFTYAGRDTVNQAAQVAPDIIKGANNDSNNIEKQRIDQIIS